MPELPQSSTPVGSVSAVDPVPVDGDRGPRDACSARRAARARARVRTTSSPPARPADARAAVGHRREQQRAVRDALVAGHPQPPAQRQRATEGQVGRHAHAVMLTRAASATRGSRARAGVPRTRRPALGDDEHEHTAATLERVRDLEVGDVDAEARGQGRHLGDHARAVGHRDAQLEQRGRRRGGRWAGCAGRRGPTPAARAASRAVAGGDDGAHPGELVEVARRARRRSRRGWRGRCRARSRDGSTRCGSCRGTRRRPGAAAPRARRSRRWPRSSASTPRAAARGSRPRPARRAARASPRSPRRRARPTHARTSANACGSVRPVGVSTHVAPTNRSAPAPSRPSCSEPAIG